jgi:hypothetical protein
VTSRTQCRRTSMPQWPRTQAAKFCGGGLFGDQAGDRVGDLGGPLLTVQPAGLAGDLESLAGMREQDAGGHRDDLDAALLRAAVCPPAAGVRDRNLFPGQGFELGVQGWLVAPDGHQVVGAAVEDQVVGMSALGV